jgi:hypothetical protein
LKAERRPGNRGASQDLDIVSMIYFGLLVDKIKINHKEKSYMLRELLLGIVLKASGDERHRIVPIGRTLIAGNCPLESVARRILSYRLTI